MGAQWGMNSIPDLPPRRLAFITLIALALATLVFVSVVLPAEFGRDPTGFGRITGIDRLRAPVVEQVQATPSAAASHAGPANTYVGAFRSDSFLIPLEFGDELEFKVRMAAGTTLVYTWATEGQTAPTDMYADFHGEARQVEPYKLMEYRQQVEPASRGSLIAPFDGVHGWFFQNRGEDKILVRLRLSGFYDLVPAGEYGNERGIEPQH